MERASGRRFGDGIMINDCIITRNSYGIRTFVGGLVIGNVVGGNDTYGLAASALTGYQSNVFWDNGVEDIHSIYDGVNLGSNSCSGYPCP